MFCSENYSMSLFNPRGFQSLISITDTFNGTEAIFKLADFFCPIACLYARTQLLGEKDSFNVIEKGVKFAIENDSITVEKDQIIYFKFESKEVLTSIVETFNNSVFLELIKQGDLANFKSKKSIIEFYDQILSYYFEQSISIPTFCHRLKKIVLDEKQLNPKCTLLKIYNRFAKNVIESASFEHLIKLFISKLISSFSSSKYEENIEKFIKNYQLH